jgi:homoprotocatechuate degradation regulator HpaR
MKDFERSLPMMLYRTLDAVMPNFRRIYAQFDLTEQQWRVVRMLWEQDKQSLQKLSQTTLISSPSLVGVIDRLARDGLVERMRSTGDRRVVNICLTGAGRALEDQVTPRVNEAYAKLEQVLSVEEWRNLYHVLDTLVTKYK